MLPMRLLITLLLTICSVSAEIVTTSESSTTSLAFSEHVSSQDLINNGQTSLSSSATTATVSNYPASNLNSGGYSNSNNTYYQTSAGHFPATATYYLDLTYYPNGYDITQISTFAGWSNGLQLRANQLYSVYVSYIDSDEFVEVASVSYEPFSGSGGSYETMVTITEDESGVIASGVDAVQFIIQDPGGYAFYRELDVHGEPTGLDLTITSPATRAIIQRDAYDLADITITGTYQTQPDRIEARAILRDESTPGATTAWETIESAPSGNTFSGTLNNVLAGGWYLIEVRSIVNDEALTSSYIDNVGVGDIYLTAGQSNSANWGRGGYVPTDDRISARESLTTNTWRHAYDPIPIANGGGGSPWGRLGDLLIAEHGIPIGIMAVGVGGTSTLDWINTLYTSNLQPAIQSFPVQGFKAILWHQGEKDNVTNTSYDTYLSRINSLISQSRTDAGWDIPWYLCEAGYAGNFPLEREEAIQAAQRAAAEADPLVYYGARTNDFHLEVADGGKLSDSVHFNEAGLDDHAQQWSEILTQTASISPLNGNFEDNTDLTITETPSLADNEVHIVDNSDVLSQTIIDWHILATSGTAGADGVNGFYNPGADTYSQAVDSLNGGVMANMDGPHVAYLSGGSAGNYLLNSSRQHAAPNSIYTLTAAIGVRDDSSTFGGVTLEILSDNVVMASSSYTKADLDLLVGGDTSGTFNDISVSWDTGSDLTEGQSLQYRIIKNNGDGTVLDVDNIRATQTSTLTSYLNFQLQYWGNDTTPHTSELEDYDQDQIPNIIEFMSGTDPTTADNILSVDPDTSSATVSLPLNKEADHSGLQLEYSHDLINWLPAGSNDNSGLVTTKTNELWSISLDQSLLEKTFFRVYSE